MRRPPREHLDISVYVRAFGVFVRNPTVIVLPLLVAVIGVLIGQLSGVTGGGAAGGITGGLTSFVLLLLELFGLGVSIIIADAGWRTGRASFDDAWQDARRKGGEIIMAAFGFTFVLSIAQYASTIVGAIGLVLMALAVYGLIYTIPAAAIGGVPGGAAISASIDRVRSAPLTSAILTIVSIVLLFYFGSFVGPYLDAWLFGLVGETTLVAALIDALIRSIITGYLAVVMAKVYADVSFTAPRF
jgi:hypothetical protein